MRERLLRAVARRVGLREVTDALRLVDGVGDGLEDLEVDEFAGAWLAQTRGGEAPQWLAKDAPGPLYWKKLGEKESPRWLAGPVLGDPFLVREHGLGYWIDFAAGYSQGLFLDQRENRRDLREMSAGRSVLNCFAYTCAFGVAAAAGGARTVNLDLSRRYLDWGRRNYEVNGLDPAAREFVQGDVMDWLRRFGKKGRRFDVIVLDPPTFSRSDRGEVFRIEKDFDRLVRAATALLTPEGALLCSTNQRSLSGSGFHRLIERGLDDAGGWRLRAAGMPPDFTGERYLKSCWVSRC